jgi:hypothetical protein
MKERKDQMPPAEDANPLWQKTQYANIVRYVPSGTLFARFKVRGKLFRTVHELAQLAALVSSARARPERNWGEWQEHSAVEALSLWQACQTILDRSRAGAKARAAYLKEAWRGIPEPDKYPTDCETFLRLVVGGRRRGD